jgi:HSP20 family protein
MPPADLHETPQEYVLSAELPGLTTGDIHIDFQDGRLTVSGTRSERTPCEGYQRIERGHGSFRRTLQLPLPVDADQITADLRDGVLTVRCPKSSAAAQRIRIS